VVRLKDGSAFCATGDVSQPLRDLDLQQAKLEAKFRALVAPKLGEARAESIIETCRALDDAESVRPLIKLCRN
jgi:hypothetical protein